MKTLMVAQSGGPTAAINATLAGVIDAAQKSPLIDRIYGSRHGIEGVLHEMFVDLTHFSETEKLKATPAMALGSCRFKLPSEWDNSVYQRIADVFSRYNVGFFVYIGGNDSMDTVKKLAAFFQGKDDAPIIVGAPKTIDNDLPGVDHTPGFGSAARYLTLTMEELCRDLSIYAVKSVTIVEIMGRDAGWLTLAAGLPRFLGGAKPDIIALPEVPFDPEEMLRTIRRLHQTQNGLVIAVSEGIKDKDGNYIGASAQSGAMDQFGHSYLAGAGKYLEHLVKDRIGCKVRSIEISLMQRCSGLLASATDLNESFALGSFAVSLACQGEQGKMAGIRRLQNHPYRTELFPLDVKDCANQTRYVPERWWDLDSPSVRREICDYLLPLIAGEAPRFYRENGLPDYVIFD